MWKKISRFVPILVIVPFIFGVTGYTMAGISLKDAMYDSVSLYVIQQNADSTNAFTEIARWSAALVTTAAVLTLLKQATIFLYNRIISNLPDSTVLYGDEETCKDLAARTKRCFYNGDRLIPRAKNQVIMFSHDYENLEFYQEHKEELKNRQVYLCLRDLDLSFLKTTGGTNLHVFNPDQIMARALWKQSEIHSILKAEKERHIGIVGFDSLGQQVLNYGLLQNIFYRDQKFTYHVYGDSRFYQLNKPNFTTMNADEVIFHQKELTDELANTEKLDLIICVEQVAFDLLEALWIRYPEAQIYCQYSSDLKLAELMKDDCIHFYGNADDVYTLENIITEHLYAGGILLNYNYNHNGNEIAGVKALIANASAWKQARAEWAQLDEFTKGSNLASADYLEIVQSLKQDAHYKMLSDDDRDWELAELEHVLWCRYHILSHWKYGEPADGKNKDTVRRIHKCLVPFEDLSQEDKDKDLQVIQGL
ncbi:MAG: hypothetical protein K6A05_07005 [Lachnospiraceae bacterium]|nr:hypothetical protein [Lachnospiraceae bacterium]